MNRMAGMLVTIDNCRKYRDIDNATFLSEVPGILALETVSGLALKGVMSASDSSTPLVSSNDVLKLPKDIELEVPLCPQYSERKFFNSVEEEDRFFGEIARYGYSIPVTNTKSRREGKNNSSYCSTVLYYFVPLASCYFSDQQLLLSDSALSHLAQIDEAISKEEHETVIYSACAKFMQCFGSHFLRGPLHFGGLYICKCYSSDYDVLETLESIQQLHNDVINAQMSMCFDRCYTKTCVSHITQLPGSSSLKHHTYLEVTTCGGPQKAIAFPDWKNGLMGSNTLWKLIDCGINQVPIWDIISLSHSKAVAIHMKQCWKVQRSGELDNHFETFIRSLDIKPPIDTKLFLILAQKNDIKRQLLDPSVWASEYLPSLVGYLCSIVRRCSDTEFEQIKPLLKEIIEPIDLVVDFSLQKEFVKKVFGTYQMHLQLEFQDFRSVYKFLNTTLKVLISKDQ